MHSPSLALSPAHAKFLEDHFVIYDPRTRKTSTNFSGLLSSKVILFGVQHYSKSIDAVVNQYFRDFEKEPSCLLCEGISPGNEIPHNDMRTSNFPDLPPTVSVVGSDVRYDNTSPEASCRERTIYKWHSLLNQLAPLLADECAGAIRQIAPFVNSLVTARRAQIRNGEILLSSQDLENIKVLLQVPLQLKKLFDEGSKAIQEHSKRTIYVELTRSNKALAQLICKTSIQQTKIYAMWGYGHFIHGKAIYEVLDRENVRYTVLLPNRALIHKADAEATHTTDNRSFHLAFREESNWLTSYFSCLSFRKSSQITLPVPEEFASLFHATIPKLYWQTAPATKPAHITLDERTITSFLRSDTLFEIPAKTEVKLTQIHEEDAVFFVEMRNGAVSPSLFKMVEDHLLAIISYRCGIQVQALHANGVAINASFDDYDYVLRLQSDYPIIIECSSHPVVN